MVHARSLTLKDWLARLWRGPVTLPSSLRLEWQLVLVRWVGIVCIAPGLFLAHLSLAQLVAAYAVIALDVVFNAGVQIGLARAPRVFERGLITMLGDSLITVMAVVAGGGADSPLSYAFYLVAVSAALRYGYRSLLVAVFFVGANALEKSTSSLLSDAPFIMRSVFLCLTVIVTSYIYAQLRQAETALLRQELRAAATINEALEHQAQHDLLTALPNRALLQARLGQAIQDFEAGGPSQALLLLDLDRFKEVNDTFGHRFGDLLLQQVGPRVHAVIGSAGLLARLGGDEFTVLLPGCDAPSARRLARAIVAALEQPFSVDGHAVSIGASIGIALLPEHGRDAEALLQHADVAMYAAKRRQTGCMLYAPEHDTHSPERLALAGDLREAIATNQLTLYLQPQVRLSDGQLTGAEALVRWRHPARGLVGPDEFIPLAEATGLIEHLTRWVLSAALAEVRALADAGLVLPISVNFSMRDLRDPELASTVAELLGRWRVPPACLTVELTESSFMDDPERALHTIERLSAMGVRVAIDDFGTGFSSLSYLTQLPVDELKIDKSFVRQLTSNPKEAAIVRSTITLAHDLGLQVVAEGIEDAPTWRCLQALDCDVAQGYVISRPMPVQDFRRWLREHDGAGWWHAAAA